MNGFDFSGIDWANTDWLRLGSWLVTSVISFWLLIKFLKFIAGFIIGLIITLIAGWMFYKGMLF